MGLFSSNKSTTNSSTTQNFYDQRSVVDAGGGVAGDGNTVDASNDYTYLSDASNRSTTTNDDRDTYSYWSDASNRSTTTINGSDPGAVRLGELNAQLLGAVAESQTDAAKFMFNAGSDTLRAMGGSATDMLSLAASNSARAWSHTLDASGGLIDRLITSSERQSDGARALAASALSSYQPSEGKSADTLKWVGIAAAIVAIMFAFKG